MNEERITVFPFWTRSTVAIDICDGAKTINIDLSVETAKAFVNQINKVIKKYEEIETEVKKWVKDENNENTKTICTNNSAYNSHRLRK